MHILLINTASALILMSDTALFLQCFTTLLSFFHTSLQCRCVTNCIDHNCDPAPLNEALWGEYQNYWEKYFIAINTIFYTFWCKIDYSAIFLSKVTKCWTLACRIPSKIALQRYGLSKIVIYMSFCRPIKNKMFRNTSFLQQFHWKKCLIEFGMILERIYQKRKLLTLAHIFAYNSKSILPQRASFSHAGTHINIMETTLKTKSKLKEKTAM